MFGVICPGRQVEIAQQIEQFQYLVKIEKSSKISHITLFILPDIQFDPNYSALIYFNLDHNNINSTNSIIANSPNGNFTLFGSLSLEKPSAIFKINSNANKQIQNQNSLTQIDDVDMDLDNSTSNVNLSSNFSNINNIGIIDNSYIIIGISISPNSEAMNLLQQMKNSQLNQPKLLNDSNQISKPNLNNEEIEYLSNKIISNCYNYLSGFVDNNGKVSIMKFNNWWDNFKNKLKNNPNFLTKPSD
ncbi:Opi10p ASCRUDRAFT_67860 [Ascoidea rubescens DSM 1968]|uniref:Uncharacterized protein n=1 Tax=Ascoidea rubescens DSM 1968 TaxID=1344418 RepID=A0A1D2VQ96_9ASCO|nr:hypothetical protein ASCRUDRAFT_67860 [Ascoidea rubescens DSM 1968]ODV63793.1 hypothetical protein ASCRUDRAFT_67860 [Ascoidea rubescens DSM 1968]